MARVPELTADDIPAAYRAAFTEISENYPAFANQVPVYAHSPVGMSHIFAMTKALRETGNLAPRLVEIAVVAASHANRCAYCVAHHSTVLVELGLDADSIATLDGGGAGSLSEEERLVRDYAIAVTERAWGIRDAMFARLEEHFSHTQIVELTMRIALTGLFNKVNQALGIEMEDGLMADFMAKGLAADQLPAEDQSSENKGS